MALTETQVTNRRSLGLKDDATIGQVFDVIEQALVLSRLAGGDDIALGAKRIVEGIELRQEQYQRHSLNKGLTKGATPYRTAPAVKQYLCAECEKPMTKSGTGLGRWFCSNRAHNTLGKRQSYGRAVAKKI